MTVSHARDAGGRLELVKIGAVSAPSRIPIQAGRGFARPIKNLRMRLLSCGKRGRLATVQVDFRIDF
jgi:hypothetical protein